MTRGITGGLLNIIRWLVFLGLLAAAGIYLWQPDAPAETGNAPMEAFFINTRNDADAIVLIQGKSCVLVDTGEHTDAGAVLDLLFKKGVEEVKVMLLTHPDADHIGGAKQILESIPVKLVVQPLYQKKNANLEELNAIIEEKRIPVVYPTRTRKFSAGKIKLLVYPPLESSYKRDNNYSLAALVTHGSVNLVLPGDAEEKRLQELLEIRWPKVALYKAAHHGRASPSSDAFIRALSPEFVVVTSSVSDSAIQLASADVGARVFYTGKAAAAFISDGSVLLPDVRE